MKYERRRFGYDAQGVVDIPEGSIVDTRLDSVDSVVALVPVPVPEEESE